MQELPPASVSRPLPPTPKEPLPLRGPPIVNRLPPANEALVPTLKATGEPMVLAPDTEIAAAPRVLLNVNVPLPPTVVPTPPRNVNEPSVWPAARTTDPVVPNEPKVATVPTPSGMPPAVPLLDDQFAGLSHDVSDVPLQTPGESHVAGTIGVDLTLAQHATVDPKIVEPCGHRLDDGGTRQSAIAGAVQAPPSE